MSLTTRCPACATTFRVVPDQLKLSDGWVRCGHCADVFDATRYLETWSPPEVEPTRAADGGSDPSAGATSQPESSVQDARSVPAAPAREAATEPSPVVISRSDHPADAGMGDMPIVNRPELLPEVEPTEEVPAPQPQADEPAAAPTAEAATGFESTDVAPLPDGGPPAPLPGDDRDDLDRLLDRMLDEEAVREPAADLPGDLPTDADAYVSPASDLRTATASAAGADDADFQTELQRYADRLKKPDAAPAESPETAASAPLKAPAPTSPQPADDDLDDAGDLQAGDEPEFVRQARRRAFWHSPGMRAVLVLVVLLLSALLAGQWAVHERDRLAASQPQLLPWLTRLCEPLGCRVSPVRDIDAIVIDSSTLVRRLGNFYSFDLVLKNTSTLALAVPALELSLTDTGDRVISRRVFLPEELPGVPPLLPAQGSVPVSLRLSLGDQLPMAGYRALIFYP